MLDIKDHIHGEPVVRCKNPECHVGLFDFVYLPLANPPRIGETRETTPLDGRTINYICRNCYHLSIFGKDDVGWLPIIDRVKDLSDPHTALWKIRYICGQENCGDQVVVFVNAETSYDREEIISFLLHANEIPKCANGHHDLGGIKIVFVGEALIL
jgi:hypothetical protein